MSVLRKDWDKTANANPTEMSMPLESVAKPASYAILKKNNTMFDLLYT